MGSFFTLPVVLVYISYCLNYANSVTILKCCDETQSLNWDGTNCAPFHKSWHFKIWSTINRTFLQYWPPEFKFETRFPQCLNTPLTYFPSYENMSPVIVQETGSLLSVHYESEFSAESFCISPTGFMGCYQHKVKKCCSRSEIYSQEEMKCVPSDEKHEHRNYNFTQIQLPECNSNEFLNVGEHNVSKWLYLYGSLTDKYGPKTNDEFCVDFISGKDSSLPHMFICAKDNRHIFQVWTMVFFQAALVLLLISTSRLLCSYHKLYWRSQACFIVFLMIGNFIQTAIHVPVEYMETNEGCSITTITLQFFLLTAFFWLMTMCYYVFKIHQDTQDCGTISGSTYPNGYQYQSSFYKYSLFSLFTPVVMITIAILVDQSFNSKYPTILRPQFNHNGCWFKSGVFMRIVYFFGPLTSIILMNIVLLLFMLRLKLLRSLKTTPDFDENFEEKKELLRLCSTLVFVMAMSWMTNAWSWIASAVSFINLSVLTNLWILMQTGAVLYAIGKNSMLNHEISRVFNFIVCSSRSTEHSSDM